jgi:hypothetical protein
MKEEIYGSEFLQDLLLVCIKGRCLLMNIKIDTAINHFIDDYYDCKITNTPIMVSLDDAELIVKVLDKIHIEDTIDNLEELLDRIRDNVYDIETMLDAMEVE